MVNKMCKARCSTAGHQRFTQCLDGVDFVRRQNLQWYLLLSSMLGGDFYLAAGNVETQQANAGIANKYAS